MPFEQISAGANVPSNSKRDVLRIARTLFWGLAPKWDGYGDRPQDECRDRPQ